MTLGGQKAVGAGATSDFLLASPMTFPVEAGREYRN